MIKSKIKEYAENRDIIFDEVKKKCGFTDNVLPRTEYVLMYKNRENIRLGAYVNTKNRQFFFPACKEWKIKAKGVDKFRIYVKENEHFVPVRVEDVMEKRDFENYYVLLLREEERKKYFLELYHKNENVFSIETADFWFKCGIDLKIAYTTEKNNTFLHWIYREEKHVLLWETKDRWFSESEHFVKNRKSLNIFNGDYVELFFHYENCKRFYVAEYFARTNGDYFSLLPKQFEDDDTCNYIVGFKKDRYEDILFMNYCVQSEIGGYAVYGFEVKELSKGCVREKGEEAFYEELKSIWETIDYELQCREILKHIYKVKNMKEDLSCVPKLEYFDRTQAQSTSVAEYTQEHYRILERDDYPKFKGRYNAIYDELVEQGVVEVKWKSEYELYKMVKRKYPDSIYQYRKNWLGMQSLDVYIPSLKIGIEYQGEQHYRAISLFGGEEGFEYRKMLDVKKRKLCKENDVQLIEWKYDEKISTVLLNKKLKEMLGK